MYHTGSFPHEWDFRNKRVGVIGSGSTGVQVMTALGKPGMVKKLVSFQRTPQYSVPSGDGPVTEEQRKKFNEGYLDGSLWNQGGLCLRYLVSHADSPAVFNSAVGFGFDESPTPTFSVSEEERQRKSAWQ